MQVPGAVGAQRHLMMRGNQLLLLPYASTDRLVALRPRPTSVADAWMTVTQKRLLMSMLCVADCCQQELSAMQPPEGTGVSQRSGLAGDVLEGCNAQQQTSPSLQFL